MTQMTFEEVAEWAAALPDDEQVYFDRVRGHIRLGDVVFADVGRVLDLWSHCGHRLTPATARALGEALQQWAELRS